VTAEILACPELLVIDGAGHLPNLEAESKFAEDPSVPHLARRRPADPKRPPAPSQHPGNMALGR